jgi:hypothetical protein
MVATIISIAKILLLLLLLLFNVLFAESFSTPRPKIMMGYTSTAHQQFLQMLRHGKLSSWQLIHPSGGSDCTSRNIGTSSSSSSISSRIRRIISLHLSSTAASSTTEQQVETATTVPLPQGSSSSSSPLGRITISTPRNTPTKKQKVAVIGSGAVGS